MKVQDTNQGVALDHDGLVIRLRVNGEERPRVLELRTTLLDALRDGLGLTASSPSPGRVLECSVRPAVPSSESASADRHERLRFRSARRRIRSARRISRLDTVAFSGLARVLIDL